jgi:hypothetical protein
MEMCGESVADGCTWQNAAGNAKHPVLQVCKISLSIRDFWQASRVFF